MMKDRLLLMLQKYPSTRGVDTDNVVSGFVFSDYEDEENSGDETFEDSLEQVESNVDEVSNSYKRAAASPLGVISDLKKQRSVQ